MTISQFFMYFAVALASVIVLGLIVGAYTTKNGSMQVEEKVCCWIILLICSLNIGLYFSILIAESMP